MESFTRGLRAVKGGCRTARISAVALIAAGALTAGALPAGAADNKPPASPHAGTTPGAGTPAAGPTGLGASKAKIGKSAPAGAADPVGTAESAAVKKARTTGKPVVVDAETTETTQVTALPSGSLSLTSTSMPVRVKQNGVWHQIDLDLAKTPAGWAPIAAAHPVLFSPGGTTPLITETDPASGKRLSISWPATLPVPTVAANAATYPNVLPGVDLQVQAVDTGYREVLIVRDATAAADPGLSTLTFKITADNGLALTAGPHGALKAATAQGTAFTAAQPMAWDSTPPGSNMPKPGPGQVGATAQLTAIPTTASGSGNQATLTLKPGAAMKRGHITFPYYIDPQIIPSSEQYVELADFKANWPNSSGPTSLTAANGNHSPWNSELELGVCSLNCYYDWNGVGYSQYVDRDYFDFNTSSLGQRPNGALPTIYTANFSDSIIGWGRSGTCNNSTLAMMDLRGTTGYANSSSVYPGPSGNVLSSNNSTACPGTAPLFNALGSGGVCVGCTTVTLELAADYEKADGAANYWTVSDTAVLNVVFDFPVETPTGLSISAQVNCPSSAANGIYTSAPEPTLYAAATDDNPIQLPVDLWFEVWDSTGTTKESWNTATVNPNSGATGQWTTDDGTRLPVANEFRVRAQSTGVPSGQPAIYSNWSGWFPFTDLSIPPSAAPTVASSDYPSGQWGQPQGAPGTFTLGAAGMSNIAGFAYSFDGGLGSEPVPTTTDCGYNANGGLGTSINASSYNSAGPDYANTSGELAMTPGSSQGTQLKVPNLSPGLHNLYVRSFDFAHNPSPELKYPFYVAPNYQSTSQPITVVNGDTLAATASGPGGSLVGTQTKNCCGATWHDGNQLFFNNTTSGNSFAVSFNVPDAGAWHLGANMTTSFDYGQYRVDLDAATSGPNFGLGNTNLEPFDAYTPVVSLQNLDLGTPYLTAGTHTLLFTAVGKNSSSTAYRGGIDYLALSPTTIYQAYSNAPYSAGGNANTLNATASAGGVGLQSIAGKGWIDDEQLFWNNTVNNDTLALTLTAPVESDYALGAQLTQAADYGNLRFDLADPGKPVINLDRTATTPINNENAQVTSRYVFLDAVHLTAGAHTLLITMDGTSSTTGNLYNAGISYLQLAPVTGATESSFTAAMNNHGFASDNTAPGADLDLTGGKALSLQSLAADGINAGTTAKPGSIFTVNGVTYTMPQTNANGNDNVVADGQTIPLPANTTGNPVTAIGLLLVSTCAPSAPGHITIDYQSGTPSQPALPSIPDWVTGDKTDAALTLSYVDEGHTATVNTSERPSLFAETFPVPAGQVPTSVTLPVLRDTFLPASCPGALHVLSIGLATSPAAPNNTTWAGAYASAMDTTSALPAAGGSSGMTLSQVITPSETYPTSNPDDVRIHLTNNAGSAVEFDAVTIAAQGSTGGDTTAGTPTSVTFGSASVVDIPAHSGVYSDPIPLPTTSGNLVISLYIPQDAVAATTAASYHTAPAATTYYASGNTATTQTTAVTAASQPGAFYVDELDVTDPNLNDGTIAVLGDQNALASPAGSATTWEADLPGAMASDSVTVPGGITNPSETGVTLYDNNGASLSTAENLYTNVITQEPGLRDVIVSLGANDIAALPGSANVATSATTLEDEITRLVTYIQNVANPNTQSGKVQVILTTIPPMGLAAGSVQEQVREALNNWIYTNNSTGTTANGGAYFWADTAAAVTDPNNPQSTASTYLAGGAPNAAYYTKIATTIADAILASEQGVPPTPLSARAHHM